MRPSIITVSRVRPSSIAGCEAGVDLDVRIERANGEVIETEATLLPPADKADRRPFTAWGDPAHWLGHGEVFSADELRAIAEECEGAAAEWRRER